MNKQSKPFIGINHGTKPIDFTDPAHNQTIELMPTEIHLKEDGTLKGGSSVAIVMSVPPNDLRGPIPMVYGQLSLEMWNDGLKDIGYQITKIPT